MSRRLLQLSSEYGDAFPVWERTPDLDPGPIDPETSGLSEQLIRELVTWNAQWEELFLPNLPEQEDERLQWKREGRSLAKRVELELGKEIDVQVTYEP